MKIVAIIPARGGSKSIPSKNIRDFCGKPLIAWSIETAKNCPLIDRVIVSTDNKEIADIAKKHGAEVPFLRPVEFSIDTIGIEPVLKHTYEWLKENEGYEADCLIMILPTSPARKSDHLTEAIKIFKKTSADSVITVNETPANHTPYWTLTRNTENKVTLWENIPLKKILTRRQDFPQKCYARNDIAYVLKPKNLYDSERSNLYGDRVELCVTAEPAKYEMDINTPDEWEVSEIKFKKLFLNK